MARNDLLKRYLDAGMHFTRMTRDRAEAIVNDLVKAGEVRGKNAQKLVDDLVERSRKNTEQLLDTVRAEVQNQLAVVEFVTKDALQRVEGQIESLRTQIEDRLPANVSARMGRPATKAAPAPKKAAPAKKTATKKKATKKSAAKKAGAKKAGAKKAGAKKKATAKKSGS